MAASMMNNWPSVRLNNNISIPAVGFGTYKIRHEEDMIRAIDAALEWGYRVFDTAPAHGNEKHFKKALEVILPKHHLDRDDIFIISKLSHNEMYSPEAVINACQKSMKNMGIHFIDLYLIHYPGKGRIPPDSPMHKVYRSIAWATLTHLYDSGVVGSIGVSNFTVCHLQDLMSMPNVIVPTVNQVEYHPYYQDGDVLKYCREHDIAIQGYSPLGGKNSEGELLADPAVKKIAADLEVTPAQVLLVWSLQNDIATLFKSVQPERIRENSQLNFKLSKTHMNILNNLNVQKKYGYNPQVYH